MICMENIEVGDSVRFNKDCFLPEAIEHTEGGYTVFKKGCRGIVVGIDTEGRFLTIEVFLSDRTEPITVNVYGFKEGIVSSGVDISSLELLEPDAHQLSTIGEQIDPLVHLPSQRIAEHIPPKERDPVDFPVILEAVNKIAA